ncbi:hypothetical protein HK104_003434 [Borealophlyctis nickersoniae]|nr:hypothetical protein HK104_003434 [Borealophlyctis nickersoniae]
MPRFSRALIASLGVALSLLQTSLAYTETLTPSQIQKCQGMWGPKDIPGHSNDNGTFTITFRKVRAPLILSVLVYNYFDQDLLEKTDTNRIIVCGDGTALEAGRCKSDDRGKFLIKTGTPHSPIFNPVEHFTHSVDSANAKDTRKLVYSVTDTGFYCVIAVPVAPMDTVDAGEPDFVVDVKIENPYGSLPAMDYVKLPVRLREMMADMLFGVLSVIYLVIGVVWMVASFLHWRDLLPIQHYVSAVTIFLTTEMAFNYGYYEDYNRWGRSSATLLVLVVVLNAARNTVSFLMLLIVSLGYGVVKPSLGSTMKKCLYLSYTHFVFGVSYAAASMLVTEVTGQIIILFAFPLAATMTAFYFWILQGLQETMGHLEARRQGVKLRMYTRLWQLLVFSVAILVIFFIINTVNFSYRNDPDWLPVNWRFRWFLLDGWLNILYLVVFIGIIILWRPTENNQRYGLDELAQDDFDDDDLRGIGGGVGRQQIKMRNVTGRMGDEEDGNENGIDPDEDEDVLRWVEQNVGNADSSEDVLFAAEDEEHRRLMERELQKMH